jgi:hypothetical protein
MQKTSFIITLMFFLSASVVLADVGLDMMGDYNMMGAGSWLGMSFVWLIYFAIGSFIFSATFWLTHNWLVKDKKKR